MRVYATTDDGRRFLYSIYKDLIIGAINEHLSSKGIDPSTVELHFSDYKLKYDGGSVIVEEQETPITNILREK